MDAVVKEINGHVGNKSWEVVNVEDVLKDAEIVPSVWTLRRKRNLVTNEITKYKSKVDHSWRKANTRDQISRNQCSCGCVVCHKVDDCLCYCSRLADMAS